MLTNIENIEKTIIDEVNFLYKADDFFDDNYSISLSSNLINDLGFSSLTLARLVMELNSKIRSNPFADKYHFSEIRTVSDLIQAYKGTTIPN